MQKLSRADHEPKIASIISFVYSRDDVVQTRTVDELFEKLKSSMRYLTRWRGNIVVRSRDSTTLSIFNVLRQCTLQQTIINPKFHSMRVLRDGRILILSSENLENLNPSRKKQFFILDITTGRIKLLCKNIEYDTESYGSSMKNTHSILELRNNNFIFANDFTNGTCLILVVNNQEARRVALSETVSNITQLENGNIVISTADGVFIWNEDLTNPKRIPNTARLHIQEIVQLTPTKLALSYGSGFRIIYTDRETIEENVSSATFVSFYKIASDKYIRHSYFNGYQVFDIDSNQQLFKVDAKPNESVTVIEQGQFIALHAHNMAEIRLYDINTQQVLERKYYLPKNKTFLGFILE